MTVPTVSVLMPVYNAERYVAEAVESVLAQTFADFEFLIIDDGSTDGSRAILERYAALDPRVRLTSRPNTGYVAALNEMLAQAWGEFIARMDADDVCMPERFEKQVAFLRAIPDHVAVGALVTLVDAEGCELQPFHSVTDHDAIDQAHLHGHGGTVCHPTLMVRRQSFADIGGYRGDFYPAEDVDLFLRLAEHGRLANVPEVLLKYRRHLTTTGHQHHTRQVAAKWQAIRAARERRGLPAGEPNKVDANRPLSVADQHGMWAWWALGAGNVATARKHARRALRVAPWSLASWKIVYCSYRGY